MARVFMREGDQNSPEQIGRKIAETVAKHSATMARNGRRYEQYSIFPQGFGARGVSMFSHPGDRIQGVDKNRSPYTANGRAFWRDHARRMLSSLKGELDRRGLAYPSAAHLDLEARVPPDEIKAWLGPALRDPRAGTDLVNGVRTLEEIHGSWTTVSGGRLTYDNRGSFWNSSRNRDLRDFAYALSEQIADWALQDTFYSVAREVFPGIRCSNWDGIIGGTVSDPLIARTKADMRRFGVDRLWADRSAPWFYPLEGVNFQGSGSGPDDWFRLLGVSRSGNLDEDYGRLMLASARAQLQTLSAQRNAEHVVPWINHPGQVYKAGQFAKNRDGSGYVYRTRTSDIRRVVDMSIDAGVKEFIFWQSDRQPVSVWNEIDSLVRDAERRAGG